MNAEQHQASMHSLSRPKNKIVCAACYVAVLAAIAHTDGTATCCTFLIASIIKSSFEHQSQAPLFSFCTVLGNSSKNLLQLNTITKQISSKFCERQHPLPCLPRPAIARSNVSVPCIESFSRDDVVTSRSQVKASTNILLLLFSLHDSCLTS